MNQGGVGEEARNRSMGYSGSPSGPGLQERGAMFFASGV